MVEKGGMWVSEYLSEDCSPFVPAEFNSSTAYIQKKPQIRSLQLSKFHKVSRSWNRLPGQDTEMTQVSAAALAPSVTSRPPGGALLALRGEHSLVLDLWTLSKESQRMCISLDLAPFA